MSIGKAWITKPRNTVEYLDGLDKFLDFAFANASVENAIKCPCPKCGFMKWQSIDVVRDHLICKPFPRTYEIWTFHGEKIVQLHPRNIDNMQEVVHSSNPMEILINEAFGFSRQHATECNTSQRLVGEYETSSDESNKDCGDFYELLKDGNEELYQGCKKYSKLKFLVKLDYIKCLCKVSDKGMTMILELLKDSFEDAKIPTYFYEAKEVINKLCLDYTQIHACPNNCMLYWGEDEEREECKRCHTSRGKSNSQESRDNVSGCHKKKYNSIIDYHGGIKGKYLIRR